MTVFLAILTPAVGIIGLVAGVLLNEFVRRRNRRELFAPKVFEKRLAIYEELADLINDGGEVATEVIERGDLTAEQRKELISAPILKIAEYTDKHRLYLDEDLAIHCATVFVGVEDIHDAAARKKAGLRDNYHHLRVEAFRMIAEDSGIAEINKLFKSINRPKLSSPVIDYVRELRTKKAR